MHQVAKVLSFSFSISPSNEYLGLNSFMIGWFDLLAVKGLSRIFSNTTVQKHQFLSALLSLVQLSHPYMTTGKTIAWTIWTQCTSPEHPASCIKPGLYMFQCYSLKSSHPHFLPQHPIVCSFHLCLFCCLTYRVIITIFLNSIYMC